MRDRSQRLHWIETLIGKDRQEARRNNALVIPTDDGDMAIAFSSIVEVVAASRVQPLASCPSSSAACCSAATSWPHRRHESPRHWTGARRARRRGRMPVGAAVLRHALRRRPRRNRTCLLAIERRPSFPSETLPLLDIDAVAKALLALD